MKRTMLALTVAMLLLASNGEALAKKGSGKRGSNPVVAAHVPAELLVRLAAPDDAASVAELLGSVSGTRSERVAGTDYYLFGLRAGSDLEAAIEVLEADLRVDRAELHFIGEAPEGDPSTSKVLGGDVLLAVSTQGALDVLDLPAAHALSTGSGVVVAVLDTGVEMTHPLLAGRVAADGFDFVDGDADPSDMANGIDEDGDGVADEQFGHGTFVSSLVLTVAPGARILPVRVLNSDGRGTTARLAAGIAWAVDHGASVINLSLDVTGDARVVKDAVEYAELHDVVVVAGAGNSSLDEIAFPASYGDVIGVAATDADGVLAGFSSVGQRLSLVAPGVDLVGAYPVSLSPTGTARWSGTSFAAPLVAGTAALVRARFPALGWNAVETLLNDTALPIESLNSGGVRDLLGHGVVQPAVAVQ